MGYHTAWVGAYEFTSDLKAVLHLFREFVLHIATKIDEIDRQLK